MPSYRSVLMRWQSVLLGYVSSILGLMDGGVCFSENNEIPLM